MKQISEEDRKILKGNLAMRDNPNSSRVQRSIANTAILEMVNKYCSEEINKAWEECFKIDVDSFSSVEDINLCNSKSYNIK